MKEKIKSCLPGLNSLLFIYNNDSSVLQALKDYTAGTTAASRAECPLCELTHSPVGMKKEWKRFIRDLGIPSRFLNRNEFVAEFGQYETTFPVVLLEKETGLAILIGPEEINRCRTLSDIIVLLDQHLQYVTGGFRSTGPS